jgi:hypothetical protein
VAIRGVGGHTTTTYIITHHSPCLLGFILSSSDVKKHFAASRLVQAVAEEVFLLPLGGMMQYTQHTQHTHAHIHTHTHRHKHLHIILLGWYELPWCLVCPPVSLEEALPSYRRRRTHLCVEGLGNGNECLIALCSCYTQHHCMPLNKKK